MRSICKRHSRLLAGAGTGLVALSGLLVPATAAFAAGSGYAPGSPPPATAAAGGFTTVVVAETVTSSGGTVTGSANGATATVTVPAGSLPSGGEVVISAAPPGSIDAGTGLTVVADFSVVVLDSTTGAKLTGPFDPAITITITDPSIAPGDSVVIVTAPGQVTTVSGAQVTQGQAVATFTDDPNFAVVRATPIPSATSVHTGEPFVADQWLAGVLFLVGVTLMVLGGRRRPA